MVLFLIFQNMEDCFSNKGYFEKENKMSGHEQALLGSEGSVSRRRGRAVRHSCLSHPKLPPVGRAFSSWMGMRFCQVQLGGGIFWDDVMVILFYHVDTLGRLCNVKPNLNSETNPLACDEGRRLHNGKRQGHRVRCSQLHRRGAGPQAASLLLPLASGSGMRWGCTHGGAPTGEPVYSWRDWFFNGQYKSTVGPCGTEVPLH